MTIRHMDIIPLKVSEGDLPSATAAYIARATIRSAVTGERFSWRHKRHDLVFTKVYLPAGVRKAYQRPSFLWAKMERAEIRKTPRRTGEHKQTKAEFAALIEQIDTPGPKLLSRKELAPAWREDAQLGYHIVLPMPYEFSVEQNRALLEEFLQDAFLVHGYICQAAMHRPDPQSSLNWHAHLLLPPREVVDGGKVGNKIRGVLADFTNRPGGKGYVSKDVSWPDRWLAYQVDFARRHRIPIKVLPKSAIRVPHIRSAKRIKNGDRNAALEEAKADAAAALLIPGLLPEVLTEHRPTFTPAEAFDLLTRHRHPPVDADSLVKALKHFPGLVPLFDPETGLFSQRFTTASVREEERDLATAAAELHGHKTPAVRHRKFRDALRQVTAQVGNDALTKALAAAGVPSRLALIEPAGISGQRVLLALHKACRQGGYTYLDLAPNVGGAGVPGSYSRRRSLARELRIQERLEAGTDDAGTTKDDTGRSDRRPPSRKAKEAPKPWTAKTCIIVRGADQLDAATLLRLLDRAAKTGARVILIGSAEPRTALGRGGAYAIVRSAIPSAVTPTTSAKPAVALPGVPLDDARQPSLAFAAAGDRRTARPAVTLGSAQLPPPAPRPWRWPDAGLMDIHNLSLGSDCDEIRRRLAELSPTETLNVYQTLPRISDSVGNKPNPHPLAMLHRQVRGQLRRAGIDGRLGGTDVDCFEAVQLTSKWSWRNRPDLAPRRGFVDVRALLAAITAIDMADWQILREHMKLFPKWVLRDIVRGLDDLFIATQSDEVRYAISVAKLQIWVMAKDSGRDLVPNIPREDLWSHISSHQRMHPNVRFDDKDGAVPLILAATLPPPGYRPREPIAVPPFKPVAQPLWLQRPAWSPLGDYGVHPDSGERSTHFARLRTASDEQRLHYQKSLLHIYANARDLAMRAWCAVGLQHCASWHRQTGTPMPIELEIVDEHANFAVLDWRFAGGSKDNPFQAGRARIGLERLAREFLHADDRDRQLALAERIAAVRQYHDMPGSLQQLLAAAQAPANHLRLQSGAPDPVVFGALLADLAHRLAEPLDGAPGKPAQSGTETPQRSHDPAVDVIAASRGASASGHGPRAM